MPNKVPNFTIDLIPGLPKIPYKGGVGAALGFIAHSTGNYGKPPNDPDTTESERNFMANNWPKAFVHFIVDWNGIVQVADTNYICYGAGYDANHNGYIQVELCQTYDSDKFSTSYDNYVWILTTILADRRLPVIDSKDVLSHEEASAIFHQTDHKDPIAYLRSHNKSWQDLLDDVCFEKALMCTKLLQKKNDWRANAVIGGKASGQNMKFLFDNFAKLCSAKPNNVDDLLNMLLVQGIISVRDKPDWKINLTQPGKMVEGGYARTVLIRMGAKACISTK